MWHTKTYIIPDTILPTQDKPSCVKVAIEHDETGQAMRVRQDACNVEGVFPVLAAWYEFTQVRLVWFVHVWGMF